MANKLKKLEKLTVGSKATDADIKELSVLIKKGIAKHHEDSLLTAKEKKLVKEAKADINKKADSFASITAPLKAAKKKIRESEVNALIHELRKRK